MAFTWRRPRKFFAHSDLVDIRRYPLKSAGVGLAFRHTACAWRLPGLIFKEWLGRRLAVLSSVCRARGRRLLVLVVHRDQNSHQDWRWSFRWMGVCERARRRLMAALYAFGF